MKIAKIISIATAALTLALSLAACGGEPAAQIDVNVKISNDIDSSVILDTTTVTVDEGSSVLDVIEEVCEDNYLDIDFNDDFTSVEGIGDAVFTKNDDGTLSYWYFRINKKEVDGTADAITVNAGDTLEYIYALSETNKVVFKVIVEEEVVIDELLNEGLLENLIELACGSYELTDDNKTVEDIRDWETKEADGYKYYWVYRLNGNLVKSPNVGEAKIYGGDVVEFEYVKEEIKTEKE